MVIGNCLKTSQKEKAPHLSTVRHFPRPPGVHYVMCVPGLVTAVHRHRPSSEVKMLPVAGTRLSGAGGVVTVVTNNSTTAAAVAGI